MKRWFGNGGRMRAISRNCLVVVISLVFIISLAACASQSNPSSQAATPKGAAASQTQKVAAEGGSYTNVTPTGLAEMLKSKDFPLVNVHIPYEGEIESTDLFIPYNEIDKQLGTLPADKGAKIVLYCRSGNMSDIAARTLVKQGYTNVYNLDGGMNAWRNAGLPIAEKNR